MNRDNFMSLMKRINYSNYNREDVLNNISSFLDEYETLNESRPLDEIEPDLLKYLNSNGLYITKYGEIITYGNIKPIVFVCLIDKNRKDILYRILDTGKYKDAIDDYIPGYDDRYFDENAYDECPLLSACYSGDMDLVIKIINYGAFTLGFKKNVLDFFEDDEVMLKRILTECSFEDYHLLEVMENIELFKKLVNIDRMVLFRNDEEDFNLMTHALEKYNHEILEYLYKQGISLLPVKIPGYEYECFEKCLEVIKDFDGYSEFVRENERK